MLCSWFSYSDNFSPIIIIFNFSLFLSIAKVFSSHIHLECCHFAARYRLSPTFPLMKGGFACCAARFTLYRPCHIFQFSSLVPFLPSSLCHPRYLAWVNCSRFFVPSAWLRVPRHRNQATFKANHWAFAMQISWTTEKFIAFLVDIIRPHSSDEMPTKMPSRNQQREFHCPCVLSAT